MRSLAFVALCGLAACGSPPAKNADDDADPSVTAALADPIMTDRQLDARADTDALIPAAQPIQALVPPGEPDPSRGDASVTIVARAGRSIANHDAKSFAACDRNVSYTIGWSNRLPDGLALPADARVSEAAGSNNQNCGLRLVGFSAGSAPAGVIETYRRVATAGGFTATEVRDGNMTVIKAVRTADGAAFLASIGEATGGGSTVDLVSNRGR